MVFILIIIILFVSVGFAQVRGEVDSALKEAICFIKNSQTNDPKDPIIHGE